MPILTTLGAACARAWGFTSGLLKDPYFNLTTLLLPGNGTNGAQNNTFLDSSSNNFTITRNPTSGPNAPTQGTFSPFSQTGWGNYFDGSTTYLQINTTSATLAFSTGDFTIEGWFYFTSTPQVASNPSIVSSNSGGFLGWRPTTTGIEVFTPGVGAAVASDAFTIPINQWIHMAVVRESSSMSFYLNGARQGAAKSNTNNYAAPTSEIIIGRTGTGGPVIPGYISNLRVTKGRAVYSGSSYTVPTVPLTRTTGGTNPPQGTECSLLTCQSNRFLDSNGVNTPASSPFTIIANNSPSVVAFSPFAPTAAYTTAAVGGSGYFDGTGDYLSVANTGLLGSGDWTVEMWINAPVGQTDKPILECRNPATGTGSTTGFTLTLITSTEIRLYSGAELLKGTVNYINTWAHVAVSKKSGTTRLYLNGTSVASTASLGTMSDTTFLVAAGYYGSTSITAYGQFYMSGLRVLTGTGYDTSTITIPTSPPTAITNTSLLLNFTNAGITDATAKNDLETVGNAQISTSVSKFGGGSIAFDGSGDYLTIPSSNLLAFGTGDFTVEFWVYPTSAAATNALIMWTTIGDYFALAMNTSRNVFLDRYGSTTLATTSNTLTLNTWNHVAVARSGTTLQIYINGTSGASITNSTNWLASTIQIGNNGITSYLFGYLDDLRITKGLARYTSNFTPPSAPFPVQ